MQLHFFPGNVSSFWVLFPGNSGFFHFEPYVPKSSFSCTALEYLNLPFKLIFNWRLMDIAALKLKFLCNVLRRLFEHFILYWQEQDKCSCIASHFYIKHNQIILCFTPFLFEKCSQLIPPFTGHSSWNDRNQLMNPLIYNSYFLRPSELIDVNDFWECVQHL